MKDKRKLLKNSMLVENQFFSFSHTNSAVRRTAWRVIVVSPQSFWGADIFFYS